MSLPENVYSIEQIRQLEQIATDNYAISTIQLINKAANVAFNIIKKEYPQARSLMIFCGSGNNAAKGYLLARLALEQNLNVYVIQIEEGYLAENASLAQTDWLNNGGSIKTFSMPLPSVDIIVDAILGISLSQPLEKKWLEAIHTINQSIKPVIALDVPSGLNADTGTPLKQAIKADLTITFVGLKKGLLTGKARDYTGHLIFNDLGLPHELYDNVPTNIRIIQHSLLKSTIQKKPASSHKNNYGQVLLVGGNIGMTGSISLAAQAATRTGAGLVSVATHPSHFSLIPINTPEIISYSTDDLIPIKELLEQPTAIAIGSGLGKNEWASTVLSPCLYTGQPKVLDAGALNLLALSPSRRSDWILTPRAHEAACLLNTSIQVIEADRFKAVKKIQSLYGGICILKGAGTLIASSKGLAICVEGNAGMATSGSGDVLTGIISALLAQGIPIMKSAALGVYIHAKAGDHAAKKGQRGMIASDIIHYIREIINS